MNIFIFSFDLHKSMYFLMTDRMPLYGCAVISFEPFPVDQSSGCFKFFVIDSTAVTMLVHVFCSWRPPGTPACLADSLRCCIVLTVRM